MSETTALAVRDRQDSRSSGPVTRTQAGETKDAPANIQSPTTRSLCHIP